MSGSGRGGVEMVDTMHYKTMGTLSTYWVMLKDRVHAADAPPINVVAGPPLPVFTICAFSAFAAVDKGKKTINTKGPNDCVLQVLSADGRETALAPPRNILYKRDERKKKKKKNHTHTPKREQQSVG